MMNKSDIELCRAAGFEVLIVGRTRDDLGVGFVAFPEPHGIKAYNYTKEFKKLIALVRKEKKTRQREKMCVWTAGGMRGFESSCGGAFQQDYEDPRHYMMYCYHCGGKIKYDPPEPMFAEWNK